MSGPRFDDQPKVTIDPYAPPTARVVDVVRDVVRLPIASPWRRLTARFVDGALFLVVILPLLAIPFIEEAKLTGDLEALLMGASTLSSLALGAGLLAWTIRWWLKYGQSPGKRVVGVRIIMDDGRRAGGEALLLKRWGLLWVIRTVLACVSLNGIFDLVDALMIFSNQGRTLHDRMASTIVVNADYLPEGMLDG